MIIFAVKVNEGAGADDATEGIEFEYGDESDEDVDNIDVVSSLSFLYHQLTFAAFDLAFIVQK